jgi:acetyltransferase-like isoleucine patch superfamily enzyme
MDERGLDASVFAHLAHVREADVIRFLEAGERGRGASRAAGPAPGAGGATAANSSWMKDASVASRERGHGVVWLAFNYLFRNYLLGHLVAIAPRGVILPLHRLRGVKIGKGCYIDPTALIETAYPENVTIGDDVRVTARVVIMTHIKAPHYLRETGIVPNVLKPVVLDDHSFIGVSAVIMPGVKVGKAAVVASGAVVLGDVPPYTMVAGNPARVIRRFPAPGLEGGIR